MPDPDAASDQKAERRVSEFGWTLNRAKILFRYWTTPLNDAQFVNVSDDDKMSARAFALFAIAALTFVVRGDVLDGGSSGKFAAFASVIAAALAYGLQKLSKYLNITIRDHVLISAYASTICVMVLYVAMEAAVIAEPESRWFTERLGPYLAPALLASLVAYLALIAKAWLVDGNRASSASLLHAAFVVFGSGVIVWAVASLSNAGFNSIVSWFGHLGKMGAA